MPNFYVKVGDELIPAKCSGTSKDLRWGGRDVITIETDAMTFEQAMALFVDGVAWSVVRTDLVEEAVLDEEGNTVVDENGNPTTQTVEKTTEYDKSAWCVAGPITDNRDGTVSIKMGQKTEIEKKDQELQAVTEELEAQLLIAYGGV